MGRGGNTNLLYSDKLLNSEANHPVFSSRDIQRMSPFLQEYQKQIDELDVSNLLMGTRRQAVSGHLTSNPEYKDYSGNDYFLVKAARLPDWLASSKLKVLSAEENQKLVDDPFNELKKDINQSRSAEFILNRDGDNEISTIFTVSSKGQGYQDGWVSLKELVVAEKIIQQASQDGEWRVSENGNWLYYSDKNTKQKLALVLLSQDPDLDYLSD